MLEKDSWPATPNGAFAYASDSNPTEKVSSLAYDNTMSSSHGLKSNNADPKGSEFCGHYTVIDDKATIVGNNSFSYLLGDIDHISGYLDFFESAENKDTNDFLYDGWPEIVDFEDLDMMFRSCDSTFGIGVSKEDEFGWLSFQDDGSGDVLKSDVKFTCPDQNVVENRYSSKESSIYDSAMTNTSIRSKDSSWATEKTDSYTSFVTEPAITDRKDGFIPWEQGLGFNGKIQSRISTDSHSRTKSDAPINEHKKCTKLQSQAKGKSKGYYFGNSSPNHSNVLPNEAMQLSSGLTCQQAFASVHKQQPPKLYGYLQNPVSFVHSDNSHLSDLASVNLKPSTVKSEISDLSSLSPRGSSHTSSPLKLNKNSHGPPFEVPAQAVCKQREKHPSRQGSQSSVDSAIRNGNVTIFDPGSVGNHGNYGDREAVSLATPAELSLNAEESSTKIPNLDDISLEAASFHQLQLVMEQLDLRTKLCIRDSLYRLAQSAQQRHSHANLNVGCGDERGSSRGASPAKGTNKCNSFVDIETETNPIDRSIAHLLFHRPSDSSTTLVRNSFCFMSAAAIIFCCICLKSDTAYMLIYQSHYGTISTLCPYSQAGSRVWSK